ncbi:hypothetical protein Ccrd_009639 [Cynara cardunculus var. scolymus]|uniref:Cytochrome P450 n=1 Tax=Cynara cardunculus var. scolymus TaxID=59895 RepID=A0A103YMR8_CYNCS|nr:hypothetical protein Ccrd_009639 [Cynara cardunculus var. scolymus]
MLSSMITSVVSPPPLTCLVVTFLFLFILTVYSLIRRSHHRTQPDRLRLPPGSVGWPYIGETLKLYTENPNSFFSNREKRYGKIFKTHILGCPCVMISSPEIAKIVLVTQSHMFKPTYPPSKEKMIGPEAIFFHQGPYHSHLKKLIQSSFLPSTIKRSVSQIEDIVLRLLPTWEHDNTINTLQEMKRYAFEVAMISVFGNKLESAEMEGIKGLYQCLEKGYNSMPLDLPGTPFNKAMKVYIYTYIHIMQSTLSKNRKLMNLDLLQARKGLSEKLRRMIEKRKESGENGEGLLGAFLSSNEEEGVKMKMNESQIADNIIGVIFAAHDTTASREQEEIRCKRVEANRGITWDDTRRMPFTTRVGRFFHSLEPSTTPLTSSHTPTNSTLQDSRFLLGQTRICPSGMVPTRVPEAIWLSSRCSSYSITSPPPSGNYSSLSLINFNPGLVIWEVIGEDDGIQYGPFPVPQHGLPIRVRPLN